MDSTPEAAPQGTEAPNTNLNMEPVNNAPISEAESKSAPQALSDSQIAEYFQTTPEQIEAFNRFINANGKFEKAFKKVKDTIANPQPKAEAQTMGNVPEAVTQSQDQPQTPIQLQKPADGYLSASDIAKLQYNRMLGDAYPELDKEGYIAKGEFVKEAVSMGITVMDANGNMNDAAIRKFLDLKKQTLPATPASAPVTTAPTVQYETIEGSLTTREQAQKIMSQGTNHPQYAQAVEFMRNQVLPQKTSTTKK